MDAFGKYDLLERIGTGGMAEVFRARLRGPQGVEKTVALKRMLPVFSGEQEFVTLFRDEAHIAMALDHSNIAQVFDFGEVAGSYYLAMEFVDGLDLGRLVERVRRAGEPLPQALACLVIAEAARGLDYAHERTGSDGQPLGIVHRDVSPPNILLSRAGEVKIADFGIARATIKLHKTAAGAIMGKFRYMSPEQVEGTPLDRRSDVFSLGIVLWELLAGEHLFAGENMAHVSERVRKADVPPPSAKNPAVPPELDRITLQALARAQKERYGRAADMARELSTHLSRTAPGFSREDLAAFVSRFADAGPPEERRVISSDPSAISTAETVLDKGLARPIPLDEPRRGGSRAPLYVSVALLLAGGGLVWRYLLAAPAEKLQLGRPDAQLFAVDAAKAALPPPQPAALPPLALPHAYDAHALTACERELDGTPQGAMVSRRGVLAEDFVVLATAVNDAYAGATAAGPGPLPDDVRRRIDAAHLSREVEIATDCLFKAGALPTGLRTALEAFLRRNEAYRAEPPAYDVTALAVMLAPQDRSRWMQLVRAGGLFGAWRDPAGLLNPALRSRDAAVDRLGPEDALARAWKRYAAAAPRGPAFEVTRAERSPAGMLTLELHLLGAIDLKMLKVAGSGAPLSGQVTEQAPDHAVLAFANAPDEPLVFVGTPEIRAWAGPLR